MRYVFLGITICLLTGCQPNDKLKPGNWAGSLSPMNHPEMENPLTYDVSYVNGKLSIEIMGPDSTVMETRDPRVQNDTLYFSFEEPEEQVLLTCKMADKGNHTFAGRCTDESGKWAYFRMRSTKSSS